MAVPMRTVMAAPWGWCNVSPCFKPFFFSYNIVDFEISTPIFDPEPNMSDHAQASLHWCWLATSLQRDVFLLHIHCLVNYSGCARQNIILNGTNGDIIFHSHSQLYYYYYRYSGTRSWKIIANKGEQVKLVLKSVEFPWCGFSCSCGHLEIQNGTYADGSTTTRMCTYLLGNITIYSHVGHSLRIQAVTHVYQWVYFWASYTVISHKDTVSDGK